MSAKNVWIIDIETSPCVVYVWGMGRQYVSVDQLIEDWHIMSFSAKRLGAPSSEVVYMETRTKNDKPLLKKLWQIFNSADVVITQNGKHFDEPRIKARMMLLGFKPYKSFEHHDTYLQNKDKEFTSHGLSYLSDKFCTKYKKLKHKKFSGLSLWKECLGTTISLHPNPEAWKEMKKYNVHDVLSDEELYIKTRGWSKQKAPTIYENVTGRKCAYCGAFKLVVHGHKIKRKAKFKYMQCRACGKFQMGNRVLNKKGESK
jgi:hypothetical protein